MATSSASIPTSSSLIDGALSVLELLEGRLCAKLVPCGDRAWNGERQPSTADQEGSESGRPVKPAAALPVSSTRKSLDGDTRRRLRHPTSSRPRSGGNQLV